MSVMYVCVSVLVCVMDMDRSRALYTISGALSKHSLIQTKAREKDLDSADNKRQTSAGTQTLTFAKRFLQMFRHCIHAMSGMHCKCADSCHCGTNIGEKCISA